MSKLSRPQQLAEAYFIKTLPHKIGLSEFQTIYGAGYNSGYLDAIAEMRSKLSPSSAAPQADDCGDEFLEVDDLLATDWEVVE